MSDLTERMKRAAQERREQEHGERQVAARFAQKEMLADLLEVIEEELEDHKHGLDLYRPACERCLRKLVLRRMVKMAVSTLSRGDIDEAELDWKDGEEAPCKKHE